ncbi:MAG: hypothetical protein HOP11_04080, partial [Saprospiraceae bacterium]|nr:hypothetical protein [Saprospiraceae bacterium]
MKNLIILGFSLLILLTSCAFDQQKTEFSSEINDANGSLSLNSKYNRFEKEEKSNIGLSESEKLVLNCDGEIRDLSIEELNNYYKEYF